MGTNGNRIEWVDIAKGYGIILVLIGHLGVPLITPFLYTFHMPLFFFLSGYVFSTKNGIRLFIFHKIRKILIPYFFLCIPILIANIIFEYEGSFCFDNIQIEILNFVIQERYTTLWFLSCLFLLNLLLYPIVKMTTVKMQYIVVSSIAITGLLLWRFGVAALPWNCDISFVVLPFMFLGYRMKINDTNRQMKKVNWYYVVFFLSITGILGLANHIYTGLPVDLFYSRFTIEPLAYLNALFGITAIISLSMITKNNVLKYIGNNSLLYFAWHQSIIFPIIKIVLSELKVFQVYSYSNELLKLVIPIIYIIITIIVITFLNELIIRSRFKFVIGK